MPASTTAQPLLPHVKHRKQTWFRRKIADPWKRFNFVEALFVKRAKASPPRSIFIGQQLPSEYFDKKGRVLKSRKFYTNQNVTSKYTVLTFLPRNLLEQFRRVANVFFLAINILQFFPKFSTISPGLVILPLLIVLLITALKDGYEDIKRHQADHKTNHSIVHVLGGEGYENPNPMKSKSKTFVPAIPLPKIKSRKARKAEKAQQEATTLQAGVTASEPAPEPRPTGGDLSRARSQVSTWDDDPEAGDDDNELGWHRVIWEDLKVGDIVKLYDNEQFPADIAILATSEEEDVAYIETKNLDGETNLKSRHGVPGLNHLSSAESCKAARLRIDLDAPEVNMFRLNGAIVNMDETSTNGEPEIHPVTLETTCLRACVLKNTAWVIGVVLFTGTDTKVVQNSGNTPSKRSKVERQMDPQVLVNLALLALVAMVCAVVDHFNEVRWYRDNSYWTLYDDRPGDNPNINGLVTFANAFITFQNIVPISLYISIEFVRTCQAAFIYWDHAIKYVHNGVTTRTVARAWTLSDDLGQIQYIFSDKTGTLTQNAMIFRQCSVGGKIYIGDGQTPETLKADKSEATTSSASSGSTNDEVKVVLPKEVLAPFHDDRLDKDLKDVDTDQSRILHGFFSVLGLCHTVLAAHTDSGAIEYKAQSPDEAALVQSAADVGFVFLGRDHNVMKLKTPFSDTPDEYELLHVLEFNSARKRMSVILRKMDEDGRLFLLTKGADNIIFDRLNNDGSQRELRQKTDKDLQEFASEGLRTLCLAYKILDPVEYEKWAADYHHASVSLEDRESRVDAVSERMEQNLILLGATAIEDKLQDGVPETISDLKRAGIKVWVATGDKLETAVAIGYTTHLLTPETNLIIVREGNHSVKDQIKEALESFFSDQPLTRHSTRHSAHGPPNTELDRPQLERVNTGVQSLVGADNGTRPGGFSLVIEGHALAHAFSDDETNDYLLALSMRCNTVICCRVSPLQKAQIVHLIKDNLGVMCLAIGDGANDVSMIQAADVGVGISGEEGLQAVNSSDYAIAQFRYLRRLLFVHGHWSYFRNSSMILNFFYKNMIGIGVLFWYQIYCGWSTTYVFAYIYLLFWNVFWTIAPVLVIGLFDKNIDADTLMALPELYSYSRSQEYFKFGRFVWYMFEGIYQSAVIFFFLAYTYVTTTTRGDGWDVYIYEMSTTMVIAAVMAANFFSGLNINLWNNWTWFGIFLGPVLIWVFTAVYSVIPPSSFYTGVYGNDLWLFRSAAYWFGWIFVVIIALLPRYLYKYMVQNYSSNDIERMRLVRKFHPELDVATHPLLGGKLGVDGRVEDKQGNIAMEEMPHAEGRASSTADGHDPEVGRPSMGGGRSSMQSYRLGMHSSARGSAVDMSTGLTREPSRGFDFTVEENGVAMARMQSRLSQASSRRRGILRPSRLQTLGEGSATHASGTSTANPFGFARIRERAGSVLHPFSPKKRDRANTMATSKSARSMASAGTGPGSDAVPPLPTEPSSPASPTLATHAAPTERRNTDGSNNSSKAGAGEDEELGGHGPSVFGTGRMAAPPEPPRL